jgi:hypothetical protein
MCAASTYAPTHLFLPSCSPNNVCGLSMTVAVNCLANGGPWAGCPPNGVDDGSLRLPVSVSMRSSVGVRSVGSDCLALGAPCSLFELGGTGYSPSGTYRLSLPSSASLALAPLLLWAQIPAQAGPAAVYVCQEPLGGLGSKCSVGGALTTADVVIPFVNGTARALISNPDLTGSGRPSFRVFLSLPANDSTGVAQVGIVVLT